MGKQQVHLMPGDDLELALSRRPDGRLGLTSDELEVEWHGVDEVHMTTRWPCPNPDRHMPAIGLRARLARAWAALRNR